jgi:hypothetical protein
MDDGAVRMITRSDGSRFRLGDRVRSGSPGELDLIVAD